MSALGRTECVKCGKVTARRLPARFPHLCDLCLFPPKPRDTHAVDPPSFMPVVNLIEQLRERNIVIGTMSPGDRRSDGGT